MRKKLSHPDFQRKCNEQVGKQVSVGLVCQVSRSVGLHMCLRKTQKFPSKMWEKKKIFESLCSVNFYVLYLIFKEK